MENKKMGKYEVLMTLLALLVFLSVIVCALFTPFIKETNIGEEYADKTEKLIYTAYKYDSYNDYYYKSTSDYESYMYDEDDDDYDDSFYRTTAENERKKIKRDMKTIEESDDSVNMRSEFVLLSKYIKYMNQVTEDGLSDFNFIFALSLGVIVLNISLAIVALILFIYTCINLLIRKGTMKDIQKRVRVLLYVMVPAVLSVYLQYVFITGRNCYSFGTGYITAFAAIFVFIFIGWIVDVQSKLQKVELPEKFLINRLILFIMLAASGAGILMNFAPGIRYHGDYYGGKDIIVGSVAVESLYTLSWNHEEKIAYELEHEDQEYEDYNEYYGEINSIESKSLAAGILIIIAMFLTIGLFCSISASLFREKKSSHCRVLAIINTVLYVAAYVLIRIVRSGYMEIINDVDGLEGEIFSVGIGLKILIFIHIFIAAADIWENYIHRVMERRESRKIADEEKSEPKEEINNIDTEEGAVTAEP